MHDTPDDCSAPSTRFASGSDSSFSHALSVVERAVEELGEHLVYNPPFRSRPAVALLEHRFRRAALHSPDQLRVVTATSAVMLALAKLLNVTLPNGRQLSLALTALEDVWHRVNASVVSEWADARGYQAEMTLRQEGEDPELDPPAEGG